MKIKIAFLFLSIGLSSCVSQKNYNEVQTQLSEEEAYNQVLIDTHKRELHHKDQQIEELKLHIKELNNQIKELESGQ